eukprot:Gb_31036 [translate_table: standard]
MFIVYKAHSSVSFNQSYSDQTQLGCVHIYIYIYIALFFFITVSLGTIRGGRKMNKLRQIIGLREIQRKWHKMAAVGNKDMVPTNVGCTHSPKNRRYFCLHDTSDEDIDSRGVSGSILRSNVPKGYMAVYVGKELRRFVIPTVYMNHSVFRVLLDKTADEFGFDQKGGLIIPCETLFFEHLIWLLNNNDPSVQSLELDELMDFYQWEIDCMPFM